MPLMENTEKPNKRKDASTDKEEDFPATASNLLLTEDVWRQKESDSFVPLNADLAALLQDAVKCRREKPRSTKQTRKEAFDRYMKMIYRLPPNIEVDLEDIFDPDKLSLYPEPCDDTPCDLGTVKEDVQLESRLNPLVNMVKKKLQKKKLPATRPRTHQHPQPKTPMEVQPTTPVITERDDEPPEDISPREQATPKTPTPPPRRPRTATPLPLREPSPEVPTFLRQFADACWFKDVYPDKKSVPSSLSPEDFSTKLLACLNTCSAPAKIKILSALQELLSQGLLQDSDALFQGLIDLAPAFVTPHMSPVERAALVEMLNLLTGLKSAGCDLLRMLVALLAFKKLGLRETVLPMLTASGVTDAEQWLLPELESWDSELQGPCDIWRGLRDRADCWLELWTAKYKGRDGFLSSKAKSKPPAVSAVDVLNYYCSEQRDECRRARCVAPAGRKNAVLLPPHEPSQPILRLGETYSMSRISRPTSLLLPPLRSRPFLTQFPGFVSLPLPRVTLCPFHVCSDEDWLRLAPRRYFIHQQSYVDYYR